MDEALSDTTQIGKCDLKINTGTGRAESYVAIIEKLFGAESHYKHTRGIHTPRRSTFVCP